MNKQYWDSLAEDYEAEVFSVFASDKNGLIKATLAEHLDKSSVVADFGCGIGLGVPLLSKTAGFVYAIDLSPQLLRRAEDRCKKCNNVSFIECDLEKSEPPIPKVDCIVSVNSLISPKASTRSSLVKKMYRCLKKTGKLILIVPSLESQLWMYNRQFESKLTQSANLSNTRRSLNTQISREVKSLAEGIVRVPDTETKCYLGPELDASLRENKFSVIRRSSLPYSWSEEFMEINDSKAACPWHWMVVAKKKR